MREPYSGYDLACACWAEVRRNMDFDAMLARIKVGPRDDPDNDFDPIYVLLEELGYCDTIHGGQHGNIKNMWIEAGSFRGARRITAFIKHWANLPPPSPNAVSLLS